MTTPDANRIVIFGGDLEARINGLYSAILNAPRGPAFNGYVNGLNDVLRTCGLPVMHLNYGSPDSFMRAFYTIPADGNIGLYVALPQDIGQIPVIEIDTPTVIANRKAHPRKFDTFVLYADGLEVAQFVKAMHTGNDLETVLQFISEKSENE